MLEKILAIVTLLLTAGFLTAIYQLLKVKAERRAIEATARKTEAEAGKIEGEQGVVILKGHIDLTSQMFHQMKEVMEYAEGLNEDVIKLREQDAKRYEEIAAVIKREEECRRALYELGERVGNLEKKTD